MRQALRILHILIGKGLVSLGLCMGLHTVSAQVTADFMASVVEGCSPLTVQFVPQTTGPVSGYSWDFGNGNTSTLPAPAVIYLNPGSYTITLIVSDGVNQDTMIKVNYITVFQDPVPQFGATPINGCIPLAVQFQDSTQLGDAPIQSYTWDFGDGSISNAVSPVHTYLSAGMYDVTLVVVDTNGCSGTLLKPDLINAGSSPVANFNWQVPGGCQVPLSVNFSSQVTPAGPYTYLWDFGDGNTSTLANPTHQYTATGTYTVTLIATSQTGCADTMTLVDAIQFEFPTALFGLGSNNLCVGEDLQVNNLSTNASVFHWDFGDGNTFTGPNPVHQYSQPGTYSMQVVAFNAFGCSDTFNLGQPIVVSPAPAATITVDEPTGCKVPHIANFSAAATNVQSYNWDFGDGGTANVANPGHVYNQLGVYDVRLMVESTNGCRDTIIQPALIQLVAPDAAFIPDTTQGCIPLGVNFNDLSVTQFDSITDWVWDFGDGGGSFLQEPSHLYTSVGQFTVTLVVSTLTGCRDTAVYQFIEAGDKPNTQFIATPLVVCAEDPVSFVDQSTLANEWEWYFGDGSSSTLQFPTHNYGDTGFFTVMLIASQFGCADTLIRPDYIYVEGPIAEFIMNPTQGCDTPLTVNFTDASILATRWQWDFGDGTQDTVQNPTHTYTQPGNYTIRLTVSNDTLICVDDYDLTLDIASPVAAFNQSDTLGCTGLPVTFVNGSVDATQYLWDFGDGDTSIQANPVHRYLVPGTYQVRLIAFGIGGCSDTVISQLPIRIVGPQAQFQGDTLTGCAPLGVRFTDQSFALPAGNIITGWFWDFGDGNTATGPNPFHTYNQAGNYDVRLAVVDNLGCSDTLIIPAYIQPTFPTAAFTTDDTLSCPGAPVTFINQSSGVGNTYLWDFGDGATSSVQNPIHIYPGASASYTVLLTVTDINGCVSQTSAVNLIEVGPPVADFFASPTQQACPPLAVSFVNQSSSNVVDWSWDFGDGTTSNLANPSKIYSLPGTFDVQLIVRTAQDCRDTLFLPSLIDLSGPGGSFSMTPLTGCTPLQVQFQANTNNAVQWTWDFGDGNLGLGQTITHTYTDDTTAFPVLVIRDTAGCTVAIPASDSIVIQAGPNPSFIVNDSTACLGQPLNFFNTTFSTVPIIQYKWDFGDGDTSSVSNPSHIYAQPGNYAVQLTLTNQNGCIDSTRVPLNISVNPLPEARFTPSQLTGCAPFTVTFLDSSVFSGGSANYLWDFGDGNVSSLKSPTHTFAVPGSYTVQLWFSDGNGCQDSMSQTITVSPAPSADFTASDVDGCAPKTIQFTDQSIGPVAIQSWFWDFGDGNTGNGPFPQHTYRGNGTFDVSLTVRDSNGCTDTRLYPDLITLDAPQANFIIGGNASCAPQAVSFTQTATADTTLTNWEWDFGDGTTDTLPSPQHTYLVAGQYDVTLIVTDANGCKDTLVQPSLVSLLAGPTASFALSDSQGCAPLSIQVSDSSLAGGGPLVSYQYSLSNGSQASLPNPTFALADTGTFLLTQIVTDVNGCTDTSSQQIVLFSGIQALFSASDSVGCTGNALTFIDQSVGANGAVSWSWDFGDGTTDSVRFPQKIYTQTGTFDVKLTVSNTYGCSDSLTKPQWVDITGPNVDFTPDSTLACPGTAVTFADNSQSNRPITQYTWDFGDGTQGSGPNASHTYTIPGTYAVQLTVTDNLGCTQTLTKPLAVRVVQAPVAAFSVSDSVGCEPLTVQFTDQSIAGDGQIVQYTWDFANGNGSAFPTPSQTFVSAGTYGVQLIVQDANGCQDTIARPIQVVGKPTASFVADLQSGCAPRPIQFISQSSGPANIVDWAWDFGDGTQGTGNLYSHIFMSEGIYDIQLTVTDINGCVDSVISPQFIQIGPPSVSIGLSDTATCPGGTISFFDQSQPDTPFVAWQWLFGNGDSASGQQISYNYTQAGRYDVILRATDALGCVGYDTIVQAVQVLQPPMAHMVLSDTAGCPPFTVQAADSSTGDRPIVSWNWDMGNGVQSSFINATATYTTPGLYTISLTATDQAGCADTAVTQIEVYGPPQANFVASKTLACVGETVSFVDVSQGNAPVQTWLWDFGDGATSFQASPTHVYTQSGRYTVQLVIFDQRGCADTIIQSNLIRITQPVADFTVTGQPGCPGTTVSFADASQADTLLTQWSWQFGDGAVASIQNPQHQYVNPGFYDVQLIVSNVLGCTDTIVKPQAIEIFQPPVAGMSLSSPAGCVPFILQAQDTSTSAVSIVQRDWFIDGQFVGGGANLQSTLNQVGGAILGLTVTDSRGCIDSTTVSVEVYPLPEADFVASDTVGCAGMVVRFSDQTPGNIITWNWDFGDGGRDSVAQPIYTYQQDGLFNVSLAVTDQNGCRDSVSKPQHIEISRPVGDFSLSYQPDCPPVPVTFAATGSSARGIASYAWDFGDGNQGSGANIVYTYQDTGRYDITLFITDSLGCTFTLVKEGAVEIFGSERPEIVDVYAASVNSKESVTLSWAANRSLDFGAYVIYWQDGGGTWQAIHENNGALDTTYIDFRPGMLDCEANPYCYKIVNRNACGIEGSLNLAETHCTNEVEATAQPNRIVLNWTGYEGWDQVSQYEIYRVENYDPVRATFLDVVPGNTRSYIDEETRCFNTYAYRIRALGGSGEEIAWSDTTLAINLKTAPTVSTELIRATVENNQTVLVEWDQFLLEDLIEVHLERSSDEGLNWQGIITLGPEADSYEDIEVNVSETSYTYRLWARDSCGFVSPYSPVGKTILLNGEELADGRSLSWTAYEEWGLGVDFYEIQVFNEATNQFVRVDVVDGNTNQYIDGATFLEQGAYCYRIIAFERGGNLSQSVSNHVCLGIDPALYLPNAFTPNGDQINDYFQIRGVYLQQVRVEIFNRWGKLMYEADSFEPGWDGRYKGENVPEGVYVVIVEAIANDGRKISKRGTITVYR